VEIIANPIGPQLHAPAIEPIIEPKIPPLIFALDFFKIRILKIFIGITTADNIDRITISTNLNSVPWGIWPTRYGSKKIYSEIINSATSMTVKTINDKRT